MSQSMGGSGGSPAGKLPAEPGDAGFPFVPQTTTGRWAIVLSVLAIVSWFGLPVITTLYRDVYPITDTWVMPAISVALTDAAALLGLLAVLRFHERSIANIVLLILFALAGAFLTIMFVGEGLAGV